MSLGTCVGSWAHAFIPSCGDDVGDASASGIRPRDINSSSRTARMHRGTMLVAPQRS